MVEAREKGTRNEESGVDCACSANECGWSDSSVEWGAVESQRRAKAPCETDCAQGGEWADSSCTLAEWQRQKLKGGGQAKHGREAVCGEIAEAECGKGMAVDFEKGGPVAEHKPGRLRSKIGLKCEIGRICAVRVRRKPVSPASSMRAPVDTAVRGRLCARSSEQAAPSLRLSPALSLFLSLWPGHVRRRSETAVLSVSKKNRRSKKKGPPFRVIPFSPSTPNPSPAAKCKLAAADRGRRDAGSPDQRQPSHSNRSARL